MKILQVCKKFPYPLKDGEAIAIATLGEALHQLGHQLSLLAMNTSKHYYSSDKLPARLGFYQSWHTSAINNHITPWGALTSLMANRSYHIARFESRTFEQKLIQLLQRETFDVVQLETLYLAPYIPAIRRYSNAVVAMRAHNVEHEIWQRIANNTKLWPKKWYLNRLAQQLREYETSQLAHYDLLIAITQRDIDHYQSMGYTGEGLVVPIGVPIGHYEPNYRAFHQLPSLAFIGSLDWMPNQEGLQWFLEEVWWRFMEKHPRLEFHIAGRNAPDWLKTITYPNVVVHGEVPDAADFLNRHSIVVTPLLSGSGMRVKILEAMALGRVVLTTNVGLEGIHARHRREVLVADTPQEMLAVLEPYLRQQAKLEAIGRRACGFVLQHYDSLTVGGILGSAYQKLCVEAVRR